MNEENVSQMIEDLKNLDINKVMAQAAVADPDAHANCREAVQKCKINFTIFLSYGYSG